MAGVLLVYHCASVGGAGAKVLDEWCWMEEKSSGWFTLKLTSIRSSCAPPIHNGLWQKLPRGPCPISFVFLTFRVPEPIVQLLLTYHPWHSPFSTHSTNLHRALSSKSLVAVELWDTCGPVCTLDTQKTLKHINGQTPFSEIQTQFVWVDSWQLEL